MIDCFRIQQNPFIIGVEVIYGVEVFIWKILANKIDHDQLMRLNICHTHIRIGICVRLGIR